MQVFVAIEGALWAASIVAEFILVARLCRERLVRKYAFFTAYITAEFFAGLVLFPIGVRGKGYAEAFRFFVILTAFLRVGVTAELYERICEHFPGIGKFRFALASILVLIAAIAAIGVFSPRIVAQWGFPQTIAEMIRRYQGEIMAALFLLTWVFFRYIVTIHQPFRPNVLAHWRIATVYFAVSGLQALAVLMTGGGTAVHPINSVMLAADIACFVFWIRSMRSSGEELPPFERLSTSQIEAVERENADLMEAVKSLPREVLARLTEN